MDTTTAPRRAAWAGAIPCVITLFEHELVNISAPPPLALMLPRVAYLSMFDAQIRKHFAQYAPPVDDGLWFDCQGRPLKWHVPVGVLFDLMASPEDLPWKLQVHFTQFPVETLLRCANEEVVRQHYMNTMKEAVYLRLGTVRPIIGMPKQDQDSLWESLKAVDCNKFWDAYRQLTAEGAKMPLKHLPIRVLMWGRPTIQLPIMPIDELERERCLADALGVFLPDLFPEFAPAHLPTPPERSESPATPAQPLATPSPPAEQPVPSAPPPPAVAVPAPAPAAPAPTPSEPLASAAQPVPTASHPLAGPSEPAPAAGSLPAAPVPHSALAPSPPADGSGHVSPAASLSPATSHRKLPPLPPLPPLPARPPSASSLAPVPAPPAPAHPPAAPAVPSEHASYTVTIQGVRPALTTGLSWLCNALSHPDGFLYAVVAKR